MSLYVASLAGLCVFAVSGALAAGRKGLDWVGVLVLACVTAIGGGTLRDLLLDLEVFWIADPTQLWVTIGAAIFSIIGFRLFDPPLGTLRVADALGLALFAISGAQIAEAAGAAPLIVVGMGVLTGTAGGVIRDVLVGEIPLLFRPTETIYSTACVAGLVLYLALQHYGVEPTWAAVVGMMTIAGLRLLAIAKKIRLPAFHTRDENND